MSVRRNEDGFVLITAMIVLAVFITLTVAIVTIVDVQTNQTGHERSGEAAFEIAESVLRAEIYQLQLNWPSSSAPAPSITCDDPSHQASGCTALAQELGTATLTPDYASATWSAQAFDNHGTGYSSTLRSTEPAWDANGDDTMWVWATATAPASGQTRTVVEQVMHRTAGLPLPKNVVTAGGLVSDNNGNKTIIDTNDQTSGIDGGVAVRCSASAPKYGTPCLGWTQTQNKDQVNPPPPAPYGAGYTDPSGTSSTLTRTQLSGLTQTAAINGTLYNPTGTSYCNPNPPNFTSCTVLTAHQGCPPEPTSGVVVVTGSCPAYTGNATWNSSTAPGALIFLSGSAAFTGTETFYGVLYMADEGLQCSGTQPSASPVLTIGGNVRLFGAVFADGCGVVAAGDSGGSQPYANLNFSPSALGGLQSYQAATPAQGTFRVVSK